MTTTEAEDVAAKILALPPTGGNVAYYVWDEAEERRGPKGDRLAGWRKL